MKTPLDLLNDLHDIASYFSHNRTIQPIITACEWCDLRGAVTATRAALTSPTIQRMVDLHHELDNWLNKAIMQTRGKAA